jgi:RING/U-box domain-containing protein
MSYKSHQRKNSIIQKKKIKPTKKEIKDQQENQCNRIFRLLYDDVPYDEFVDYFLHGTTVEERIYFINKIQSNPNFYISGHNLQSEDQLDILYFLDIKKCCRTDCEAYHYIEILTTTCIHETCEHCNMIKVVKMKTPEICSICYMDVEENANGFKLKCGHIFHKTCIENWFIHKIQCPYCRTDYTTYLCGPTPDIQPGENVQIMRCREKLPKTAKEDCTVFTPLNIYEMFIDDTTHIVYLRELFIHSSFNRTKNYVYEKTK